METDVDGTVTVTAKIKLSFKTSKAIQYVYARKRLEFKYIFT